MNTVAVVSAAIIAALSFWCVINPKVHDGVVGKCFYVMISLAALGVACVPTWASLSTLVASIASLWVRNFFTELFWPPIRARILRRIRCATCPHNQE